MPQKKSVQSVVKKMFNYLQQQGITPTIHHLIKNS